jgi:8-oxo-dGTP diphosphatase
MIPSEITDILNNDPVRNCNILYFLQDNIITGYYSNGNSVLITGISDREWVYFSSSDKNEFISLINYLCTGAYNFAVTEDWMLPLLLDRFQCRNELTVCKLYLPDNVILPAVRNTIYQLTPADADRVLDRSEYKEYLTTGYIKERISGGISAGIYNGDELIAWAVTHDDGAIGFLHVDEKFRGKGLGSDLTVYMIEKVRSINRIPFVHIEESNTISLSLVKKLGFIEYGSVSWLVKTE